MNKEFTLFWFYGKSDVVKGYTIAEAMKNAGINENAGMLLDFYVDGNKKNDYVWNTKELRWEQLKKV